MALFNTQTMETLIAQTPAALIERGLPRIPPDKKFRTQPPLITRCARFVRQFPALIT